MPSVFTRIINGDLPAKVFYETPDVIVIQDHRPRRPVHLLIIAKEEHQNFHQTPADVLATCFETAKVVAEKLGIADHYQLAVNNGLGQEVEHFHLHFLSNRGVDRLKWIRGD
jgi:histidine triad (HIT) family protein